jgi:hypothetical protein
MIVVFGLFRVIFFGFFFFLFHPKLPRQFTVQDANYLCKIANKQGIP